MSRIGRAPIKLSQGTDVKFDNGVVTVKGKLGTLTQAIENKSINVGIENGVVSVTRASEDKKVKAAHGLYRALIANMVEGVEKGYERSLLIAGVGWKATQQAGSDKVTFAVGYSNPVEVVAPKGIKITVVAPTEVKLEGIDKVLIGQFAANIRAIRKPEPYHGYGIRYKDEVILRKAGKSGKK